MIVTAILGSPHGIKGNTSVLTSWVLREAQKAGAAIAVLSLNDYQTLPCQGCGQCHRAGRCVQEDAFHTLARTSIDSDGIVLACPMHFFHVSAQMKAFVDRCGSIAMRQPWEGKHGVVVMTSGATDCRNVEEYLLNFMRLMGCWTVGSVSATVGTLNDRESREGPYEDARELGRELARCIRGRQSFPDQTPVKEAFRAHMQCMVLEHKDEWTSEYEFLQGCVSNGHS